LEELSHISKDGRVRMVDVGDKPVQLRIAEAEGHICLDAKTRQLISDVLVKKGDVLATAEIAGIQAAKRTSDLIPLCHNLSTDQISITVNIDETGVKVKSEVRCHGRTGAEMEALTAVSVALLTVYDMCKAVDKQMIISNVHLVRKEKH